MREDQVAQRLIRGAAHQQQHVEVAADQRDVLTHGSAARRRGSAPGVLLDFIVMYAEVEKPTRRGPPGS